MHQELHVLSPEKALLTYQLSGIGSRALAHFLDLMILVSFAYALGLLFAVIVAATQATAIFAAYIVAISFSPFLYFILFEGFWNGQTPGKRALRIRVRQADGTPITFSSALMRNLLRPADVLPGTYFLGLVTMFTNNRSQRLGDMVAGTVVIHEPKSIPVFQPVPPRVLIHPLEDRTGEVQRMSEAEYAVLRRLRDRLPELAPSVQERMLKEVWVPIALKYGVASDPGIHPGHFIEASVMRYEREHGLL